MLRGSKLQQTFPNTSTQFHSQFDAEKTRSSFGSCKSNQHIQNICRQRRRFKMTCPRLLALLLLPAPLLAGPPNILLIAVDNLGWDDVSWHNPAIIMPNLGTLARYSQHGVLLVLSIELSDSDSGFVQQTTLNNTPCISHVAETMQLIFHSAHTRSYSYIIDFQTRCDPGAGVWGTLKCSWESGSSYRKILVKVLVAPVLIFTSISSSSAPSQSSTGRAFLWSLQPPLSQWACQLISNYYQR